MEVSVRAKVEREGKEMTLIVLYHSERLFKIRGRRVEGNISLI